MSHVMEEEEMVASPCLMCSSPGDPIPGESPSPAGFSKNGGEESSPIGLLNSGLWSVFVLRKLLHFPQWEVECLLRELGGVHHPGDWFTLCEPCSQLAKQTMELHHQIFELHRQISDRRAEAYDRLRSSFRSAEQQEKEKSYNIGVVCARATVREYFRSHLRGRQEGQPEQHVRATIDIDPGDSGSPERDDFDEHQQNSSCPPSPSSPPSAASGSVKSDEVVASDDDNGLNGPQSNLEEEEDPSFIPKQRNNRQISTEKPRRGVKRKWKTSYSSPRLRRRKYGGRRVATATPAGGGEGTYCSICHRWFLPASYPDHVKMHEGTEARRCKHCDYIPHPEAGRWDLPRHEKMHEEDPNFVFFKCDKCDYTASTLSRKWSHIQKHKIDDNVVVETETAPSGTTTVTCKVCSAEFQNLTQATVHLRESHGPELGLKQYKCSKCGQSFSSSQTLRLHKVKVHEYHPNPKGMPPARYKCDQCDDDDVGCYLKDELEAHLAAFHPGGRKEGEGGDGVITICCDICGKGVSTKSALRSHKIRNHNRKGVLKKAAEHQACSHCDFVAPRGLRQLNQHKQWKHPELFEFQCSECPQKFIRIGRMALHYRVRHPGKNPPPQQLEQRRRANNNKVDDNNEGSNNIQQREEHPHQLFEFQCSECPQKFKRMNRMSHHYRIKHPGKSLDPLGAGSTTGSSGKAVVAPGGEGGSSCYCSICHRWFRPQDYPNHLQMHSARKCKYCEYRPKAGSPAATWDLSRHERRHEEDPSYVFFKCDKCEYTCSSHSSKSNHRRKHKIDDNIETTASGAKSCKVCSAVFETSIRVTLHLREAHGAELGLKQYKCSKCDISCSSDQTLRAHVISAHEPNRRHKCPQCGHSTHAKSALDTHMAAFHCGGKKEFICDLCGKAVSTKSALRNHKLRAHRPPDGVPHPQPPNAKKGHACKLCAFVTTNNILLHGHKQREHPELFEFQCSECPQRFIKLHALNLHSRVKHPGVVRVSAS